MSGHVTKQRVDFKLDGALVRFPGLLKDTVAANPELFLPVFLLLVWQASAISVKPTTLGLALVLTFVLLIYAYRVLGTTPWLCRLGWVVPRKGFWLHGVVAGGVASVAVWGIARLSHLSLGGVPRPNIAARELIRPNLGGAALSRSLVLGELRVSRPPWCFQIRRKCHSGPAHLCLLRSGSH